MRIDIVTLFPEMFQGFLEHSIMGRAREARLAEMHFVQLRDYAFDKHRVVDDAPYGGGAGMVMKVEPLFAAIEDIRPADATPPETQVIYMSPQGEPFTQAIACELAETAKRLILVCGRYEGVDERARRALFDRELSVGDFVLTGGELPAAVVTDAVVRLLPGVLGNEESAIHESHMDGILDYPHYTRPPEFRGESVPQILLEGHHAKIVAWRRREALRRTLRVRPDLIAKTDLTDDDRAWIDILRRDPAAPQPE